MGRSADIYIKITKGGSPLSLKITHPFTIKEADECDIDYIPHITHEIECNGLRYYNVGYERGPWLLLSEMIMELLNSEAEEKVWYGSGDFEPPEITKQEVDVISKHFLKHGNQPYRNPKC